MRLTPNQRAAYIDLIANQWLDGAFTFATALLVCRGVPESDIAFVLEQKFTQQDGLYFNERLEEERQKQQAKSDAGRLGGSKRQAKDQANVKQSGKQITKQTSSKPASKTQPSDSVSDSVSISDPRVPPVGPPVGDWEIPEHLDCPDVRESLDRYRLMRIRIRKPIRDFADSSRILKKFESVQHLLDALDLVIANEYQGLKPEYGKPRNGGSKSFGQKALEDSKSW